jgi:hypothetical protein
MLKYCLMMGEITPMSDRRYRTAENPPGRLVPRGIRPGFEWAVALALTLSLVGCQSPHPDTPQAGSLEADADPRFTADVAPAQDLEPAVSLRSAAEILPAALLTGPYHNVRDEVLARGFVHYYDIESPYGEFVAAGDDALRERIQEINAIAELRRLSKSEVIADSATDAAIRSYVAAKEVVDKPWETAKGIPSGLERLFKRSKRQAEDAYDNVSEWYQDDDSGSDRPADAPEGNQGQGLTKEKIRKAADLGIGEGQDYLKGSLGFNREFRRLARRLEVDPYTRNAMLRHELASMAWTATAGSFAANWILPDVPAPVGLMIDTQELVWNTKAIDLLLRNEEAARRMGIASDEFEAFFGNEHLTLSDQTRLVQAMERLHGAAKRGELLRNAAQVQSREEARFYVRSAELLALYHERRASIEKLIEDDHGAVAARDQDDRLIVALPLDYLNWSPTAHDVAMAMHDSLKRHAKSDVSEVWMEGTVSERARRELYRLGWTVNERAFEQLAARKQNAG